MAFITKQEAQDAAQRRTRASFNATAKTILREDARQQDLSTTAQYDVFLSHSYEDAEIVLGVRQLFTERGLKVYVDWIDDVQLDRTKVTSENADILRLRMRASKSMLLITTKNTTESKWVPWELGYFDGLRQGLVGILPVTNASTDTYIGQEYLGLYPRVERLPTNSNGFELFVVENKKKGYRALNDFARGATTIRSF